MEWLRHLYGLARQQAAQRDIDMPSFDAFWATGYVEFPVPDDPPVLFALPTAPTPKLTRSGRPRDASRSSLKPLPLLATTTARAIRSGWNLPNGWDRGRRRFIHFTCSLTSPRRGCTASSTAARSAAAPRWRSANPSGSTPTMQRRGVSPVAMWCGSTTPGRLPGRRGSHRRHPPWRRTALNWRLVRPPWTRPRSAASTNTAIPTC